MRTLLLFIIALFISGYSIAQETTTFTTASKRASGAMEKITTTTLKVGKLTYQKIETIYDIDLRPDIFMGRIIVKSMEGKFNDIKKSISSNEKAIVGFDRDACNAQDQIRRKLYRAELYIDFDVDVFRKCITDVLTAKEISDLSVHTSYMNMGMVINKKGGIETMEFRMTIHEDAAWSLRNISIEKFAQIEQNIKTRVKLSNYKPLLDLGINEIYEVVKFKNGKVSLLSDSKMEDRATYEQGEKDTEKYRIK